ncbi:MAG: DNA helicase, partial [Eubacteriales bacterium]|nr:DNA helicase [Eubacteriales bacterium]
MLKSDTLESQVIDWRAPVANLYYSGQIGPLKYTAPDGEVEGELTLKRQFGIEDSRLISIFDTDIVAQDKYLKDVLSQTTGDRLKEIITTIQAEQNYVIRYPLEKNLVVQGVAGSGKTTIALHRIAYLLYTYQKRLQPENMLILAPSPLFLNFISQVLPDLGVESVRQTTFPRFVQQILGPACPKTADSSGEIHQMLSLPAQELEARSRVMRYKGSTEFMRRLEKWLDDYEARFPLEEGLKFGPVVLYTPEELRKFLLEDEKPFPLRRRLEELKKQLKLRVKG